jgi:nucleoside 2-deoxyribosyltransferase
MRKPVIYLAGPIAGCNDVEVNRWREYVIAKLSHKYDFKNPMVRDYRGDDTTPAAEIVEGDLEDIKASDIVLAYCWQRSYGTIMEIVYAHQLKKRAVVVCPDRFYSPWLKFHASELHRTLSEAVLSLHE